METPPEGQPLPKTVAASNPPSTPKPPVPVATPAPTGAPKQPIPWSNTEWLTYYSQCNTFLLALGTKFITLLTQSSVYATAVAGAMIALRRDRDPSPLFIGIGIVAIIPIFGFWHFLHGYRNQIAETGTMMFEIEEGFVSVDEKLRLLHRMRDKAKLYGLPRTKWLANGHQIMLMVILITLGFALGSPRLDKYLNPKADPATNSPPDISHVLPSVKTNVMPVQAPELPVPATNAAAAPTVPVTPGNPVVAH